MPRKTHKWYIGAILHVTARGNHKSNIFRHETDYKLYLNYKNLCEKPIPLGGGWIA
jgi:putative transposase